MDTMINFPNLGIHLNNVGKLIHIGKLDIAYYGICIAIAVLCGIAMACYEAKRTGQESETYMDLAIYEVIFSVIGARIYYVIFKWDYYSQHLGELFNLRNGGLAIYGAVIAAVITAFAYSRIKKISFPLMVDTAGLGLVLGQIIGRWGNFFNREAFGDYTNNLFAMQLPVSAIRGDEITDIMEANSVVIEGIKFVQVHPTFLYEGLWNLGVFILMNLYKKNKAFDGEVFLMYLGGYGIGRFWIEGLRTDQLRFWNTEIAVSQVLGIVLFAAAIIIDIVVRVRRKNVIKSMQGH
ncbi:MAG: prolipoprotein diacylglyceryl transferase [Lachnospiraceae bacterium]|nr:prolipoprotein diacylglyceryl transferase [Lachnospiraceae bacterium]